MKTTTRGHRAETAAAKELEAQGYKILDQNWKTSRCEIDVIARRGNTIYFMEVKFRANQSQGSGMEYITPQKIKQMNFAAEIWNLYNGWEGDWRLLAASVTADGNHYIVEEILEIS